MINLFKSTRKKINGIVWNLIGTGIIMLLLGILIVWTDFMLQLVIGMVAIVMAYIFFYTAYRLWSFKKDIEKYFKF